MASPLVTKVQQLTDAGRVAEASTILFGEAAEADGEALLIRAVWRVQGRFVRRDIVAAREHLARAAALGHHKAALFHSYFTASGVGGPANWTEAVATLTSLASEDCDAARQLNLLQEMDLLACGFPASPPRPRLLSATPHVAVCQSFMTRNECAYLGERAHPHLTRSVVVDPASGKLIPHPVRNSSGTHFGIFDEDLVVNAINRRLAALSGTSPGNGEPLQVLQYVPGDEYRPHMDALPAEPNQRVITILVYLSDGYAGGETFFPQTGLSFRGEVGDALLFRNTTADGRSDPASLHAGLPVTQGTKLIASRWIREQPFVYPPPRPRLNI